MYRMFIYVFWAINKLLTDNTENCYEKAEHFGIVNTST